MMVSAFERPVDDLVILSCTKQAGQETALTQQLFFAERGRMGGNGDGELWGLKQTSTGGSSDGAYRKR